MQGLSTNIRPNEPFNKELFDFLYSFVTEERKQRINDVIDQRTDYLTVVLEDLYQPHNASAVIRSCDCFGVQSMHVIENLHEFTVSKKVVHGSSKWVDLYQFNEEKNNTVSAINSLKSRGYRIVATSPHEKGITVNELDVQAGPIALVFGTEKHGISKEVEQHADEFIRIPMYGFTESFNISVSAAVILSQLTNKLKDSSVQWQLSEERRNQVMMDWVRKSVRRVEILEQQFLSGSV